MPPSLEAPNPVRLTRRLLRRAICLPEPAGAQGEVITNWPRWSNELLHEVLRSIGQCTDASELRLVHDLIDHSRRCVIPVIHAPRGLCDILSRALGDNPNWY